MKKAGEFLTELTELTEFFGRKAGGGRKKAEMGEAEGGLAADFERAEGEPIKLLFAGEIVKIGRWGGV